MTDIQEPMPRWAHDNRRRLPKPLGHSATALYRIGADFYPIGWGIPDRPDRDQRTHNQPGSLCFSRPGAIVMPSLHREGNQPARIANHSLCPAGSFFPTSTGVFPLKHDKVTFAAMS